MPGEATTMTEAEALEMGLSTTVNRFDPDNQFAEQFAGDGDMPQADSMGRPIISYKQYLDFSKRGNVRMDQFAMRMIAYTRDGRPVTKTIQASKYLKWYGLGYYGMGSPEAEKARTALAVNSGEIGAMQAQIDELKDLLAGKVNLTEPTIHEEPEILDAEERQRMLDEAVAKVAQEVADANADITIFRCSDQYPECPRFFDTERGLKFHWRKDHK